MGRYDDHIWIKADDFSHIREIEFSEEFLLELLRTLLEIAEMEGDIILKATD
jgi:predicted AlkP superfamily pyrophosphatase or phosphodiesterase